jgi:hypothetical protein
MNLQLRALLIAYAVSAVGLIAGLLLVRAPARAWWRLPVYSAMAMALGVMTWSMVRKHLLSPEWAATHPKTMLYCALVLYSAYGIGLGLLLGRMSRGKTQASSVEEAP